MRASIENIFAVSPAAFWNELFFDADYNAGLYRELGFASYQVLEQQSRDDGSIRRLLRAEPPINAPGFIKKRLEGRIFYTEEGTYFPARGEWTFASGVNLAADYSKVSGTIRAEPHAQGMKHVVELDIEVHAFGLGAVIERLIEKNTRESYKTVTRFTNAFAHTRQATGVKLTCAPRDPRGAV